jgi:apolipoprotein N-acyltransferase
MPQIAQDVPDGFLNSDARKQSGSGTGSLQTVPALLLSLLTPVALTLCFPPFYLWPLALLSLAPLSICALHHPLKFRWLVWYYLLGLAYFIINLYWLSGVTGAGYLAACAYQGTYFPLYAVLMSLLARRLNCPAVLAVPIVFTALEYLRCTLFTGFSWFPLGAALAPAGLLLQSADLFGIYGLTFMACIPAGLLTDVFYHGQSGARRRSRRLIAESLAVLGLLILLLGYGAFRLSQNTFSPGPRIAVLQQNIPENLKNAGDINSDKNLFDSYMALTREAVQQHPDLIAWPETMVPGYLNTDWLNLSPGVFSPGPGQDQLVEDQQFAAELTGFSHSSGVSLLVGSSAIYFDQEGRPDERQNIAVLFTPTLGEDPVFYAKRHLVPFGEYVPLAYWPVLHRLLLKLTPLDFDYTLTPGNQWTHFVLQAGGQVWHFGVPICYEDAMPEPSREFVKPDQGKKRADFLVSISNDGWYQSLAELQQHLQLDQVRAVENRVPIARSVNGGYCGFIDSNGRVFDLVMVNGQSAFVSGIAMAQLSIDSRISPYSRYGDILPIILVIFCGSAMVVAILLHLRPLKVK